MVELFKCYPVHSRTGVRNNPADQVSSKTSVPSGISGRQIWTKVMLNTLWVRISDDVYKRRTKVGDHNCSSILTWNSDYTEFMLELHAVKYLFSSIFYAVKYLFSNILEGVINIIYNTFCWHFLSHLHFVELCDYLMRTFHRISPSSPFYNCFSSPFRVFRGHSRKYFREKYIFMNIVQYFKSSGRGLKVWEVFWML